MAGGPSACSADWPALSIAPGSSQVKADAIGAAAASRVVRRSGRCWRAARARPTPGHVPEQVRRHRPAADALRPPRRPAPSSIQPSTSAAAMASSAGGGWTMRMPADARHGPVGADAAAAASALSTRWAERRPELDAVEGRAARRRRARRPARGASRAAPAWPAGRGSTSRRCTRRPPAWPPARRCRSRCRTSVAAPRWTPPMPPVATTRMPAMWAIRIVALTVVDASAPARQQRAEVARAGLGDGCARGSASRSRSARWRRPPAGRRRWRSWPEPRPPRGPPPRRPARSRGCAAPAAPGR